MRQVSSKLLAAELAKRGKRKALELNPAFTAQNKFVLDPSRFISVQCSRRAGKTSGLAIRFFRTLESHPGAQCLYLALTRDSAKNIMWPVLQELNEQYRLGCQFKESSLTMVHPNGAILRLLGADMTNFVKRLRGIKSPGVAIDEAQDFGVHLKSLVDDVLTPVIADYPDSWLALTGTPGPVPQGYFFEITHGRKYGYSFHEWTLLENPYMPNPASFIEEVKIKRQWDDNNPTLLREWRNKWVLDAQALWIQYSESVSHFERLPESKGRYTYIMGVDLGFKDADAIAVLAWNEHGPHTYLVEEVVTHGQGITELVQQIEALRVKYDISKMVVDQGGLGLKIAEELRRRHHIPVIGAEKQRKQETVEFLNDALRLGNFKARGDSKFAQDSYLVQIDWEKSTPDRIVVKKEPHSDIIDAVIYAFKESPAYTWKPEIKKQAPAWGSKPWADETAEELERQAEEYFANLAEAEANDPYNY